MKSLVNKEIAAMRRYFIQLYYALKRQNEYDKQLIKKSPILEKLKG